MQRQNKSRDGMTWSSPQDFFYSYLKSNYNMAPGISVIRVWVGVRGASFLNVHWNTKGALVIRKWNKCGGTVHPIQHAPKPTYLHQLLLGCRWFCCSTSCRVEELEVQLSEEVRLKSGKMFNQTHIFFIAACWAVCSQALQVSVTNLFTEWCPVHASFGRGIAGCSVIL